MDPIDKVADTESMDVFEDIMRRAVCFDHLLKKKILTKAQIQRALTDTEFLTAEEKRRTLKAWVTFLRHGCQKNHFTRRLYDHLIQHCSFIAHYNRAGFYGVYFEEPETIKRFLGQFDPEGDHVSVEYGMICWYTDERYADINKAMTEAAGPYIRELVRKADAAAAKRDAQAVIAISDKNGWPVPDTLRMLVLACCLPGTDPGFKLELDLGQGERGGHKCQGRGTRRNRSSRSCGRPKFC